jgi:formylglycine-generating enzyme required for sulfatase activity
MVPVRISPFHLDATELTVGRARAALSADRSLLHAEDLVTHDPENQLFDACTWLGVDDPANDASPLNCITFDGARRLCSAAGGDLPTEAQWEFAARGRGQQRPFAWGDQLPNCCLGRFETCVASPAPVATSGCGGENDTTRDGIADMTGNVAELTLDSYVAYGSACWQQEAVLRDPMCTDTSVESNTVRGADYHSQSPHPNLAIRRQGLNGVQLEYLGFRCAYPDLP